MFITVFTRSRHLFLSWARLIRSTHSHPVPACPVWSGTIFLPLHLGRPGGSCIKVSPPKAWMHLSSSPNVPPPSPAPFRLISLVIFGDDKQLRSSPCGFLNLLSPYRISSPGFSSSCGFLQSPVTLSHIFPRIQFLMRFSPVTLSHIFPRIQFLMRVSPISCHLIPYLPQDSVFDSRQPV